MKRLILLVTILLTTGLIYAQKVVEGTVSDAKTGETLIGVTIQIKGTVIGTTTDIYGKYQLSSDQLTATSVVVFSYIGYTPSEQIPGNRTVVDVKLTPEQTMLDELVVIGYGTAKKRKVMGAVSDRKRVV